MKSSVIVLSLLAILCAIMIHTSASAQQTPSAAATPITQQPAKVQQFVRNVNSTLAATPTKKQSKVRFLRQILKDLKELGLLKNASEEAPYNKKDAQITLEKISTIVKHLLQLKKDGKTDDLKNYIDDLNKSKNFEEAVRLVRRILRRFLRRKVKKLAKKIKEIAKQGQTVVATAVAAQNTTAPAKPKRRVNRRFPIEKFLAKLEKSLLKVKRAGGVSGLWKKTRRAATRRFPRRFPRNFALRRFPQRRSSRRSAPRRRAPRRRSQRRAPRRRSVPKRRSSRRGPRRQSRRQPKRRSQRRFPRRRAARRFRRAPRRFPRRRAARRFPRRVPRRFPRRVARRVPRRANRKPFLVVNRQLLKHVVGSYLRRKQQKPRRA